jgi:hypothetical protein
MPVRPAAVLLALLCAAPQDELEKKITALVEQIQEGDLDARNRAGAALADLGPAALPRLRSRLKALDDEGRLRLEAAIRKIERRERLRVRAGTVPEVTIPAGLSVRAAVEEFNRQTGQAVTLRDVPADATVPVAIEKLPCWSALDAICRANGKVRWEPRVDGVVVGPGAARDLPRVARGQFLLVVDRVVVERWSDSASVTVLPWLLWPAGRTPDVVRFRVAELADDRGTDLRHAGAPRDDDEASLGSLDEAARRVGRRFWYWTGTAPADGATTLAKFSGTLTLQYVTDEVVDAVPSPESMVGKVRGMAGLTVKIEDVSRVGERVRAVLEVAGPEGRFPEVRDFALSGKGLRVRGRGSETTSSSGGGVRRATKECEFLFPAGVEIAALELLRDAEAETIEIPFDFSGLRIR